MAKNKEQDSDDQSKRDIIAANEQRRIDEAANEQIRIRNRDLKSRTKDDVDPPDEDE
jgi:hypothetical protein